MIFWGVLAFFILFFGFWNNLKKIEDKHPNLIGTGTQLSQMKKMPSEGYSSANDCNFNSNYTNFFSKADSVYDQCESKSDLKLVDPKIGSVEVAQCEEKSCCDDDNRTNESKIEAFPGIKGYGCSVTTFKKCSSTIAQSSEEKEQNSVQIIQLEENKTIQSSCECTGSYNTPLYHPQTPSKEEKNPGIYSDVLNNGKIKKNSSPMLLKGSPGKPSMPHGEVKTSFDSKKELHNICLRGCIINGQNIPSRDEKQFIKVMYMHPRSKGSTSNPLMRRRKLIHEAPLDIPLNRKSWQSSFLWILRGQEIESLTILHGYVGDVLICLYYIHEVTKQRHFFGQFVKKLGEQGRKIEWCPLVLRDGRTPLGEARIKIETEIFLPKRFESVLWSRTLRRGGKDGSLNCSSEQGSLCTSSVSIGSACPGIPDRRKGSRFEASMDICAAVSARHKKNSQRRFQKKQHKMDEENARLQQRLREIATKPRKGHFRK